MFHRMNSYNRVDFPLLSNIHRSIEFLPVLSQFYCRLPSDQPLIISSSTTTDMDESSDRQLATQLVEKLKGADVPCRISREDLMKLIGAAQAILKSQPMMVELSAPMKIVGDIHGQFSDLRNIFDRCGWPPLHNYLFVGDYVDRGDRQVETIALLFALKVVYPENFFLLRGNHESPEVNSFYGFKAECEQLGYGLKVYQKFNVAFNYLPLTALIEGRILCMHGGIPKGLKSLDQLRRIPRPFSIHPDSMEVDLMWADPSEVAGWQFNQTRKVGHTFGPDILQQFCRQHKLDLVVRAHQVCQNGYDFFADSKLVTLFSAPNYGGTAGNDAGVMTVAEDLTCSFEVLRFTTTEEPKVT